MCWGFCKRIVKVSGANAQPGQVRAVGDGVNSKKIGELIMPINRYRDEAIFSGVQVFATKHRDVFETD